MDIMRYDRPGHYVEGIPARDIALEEWDTLDSQLREMAVSLGLYSRHRADTHHDAPAPTIPRTPPADTPAEKE